LPEHSSRYDQADEFMELCFKLWGSWDPDSVIMDRETGVFADPSKVKRVNHEGKYYKSRGPLNITPSPQGRPSIVQAGSSNRGMDFAARWADAIIVAKQTIEDMKAYHDDIKARAVKFGRKPEDLKVFYIIKPVIGETEEIAKQRAAEPPTDLALFAALAAMSSRSSVDLSKYPLDEPMPELGGSQIQGGQTTISRYQSGGRRPTLREIATKEASGNKLDIVGTPEQVATRLEEIIDYVGGDGFVVRVDSHGYYYLKEFVETVIPVLQDRGSVRREYTGKTLRDNLMEF
jgi:FMN-dependent oxidoreductase (nitrilotriacetate monooxygenase family)